MLYACSRCCALPSWYMISYTELAVLYGLALCYRAACSLVFMIVPTHITHSLLPNVTYLIGACVTQSRCFTGSHYFVFNYVTQMPISATYTPYSFYCEIRPHPIQGTLPAYVAAAVTVCISPTAVSQVGSSPTTSIRDNSKMCL